MAKWESITIIITPQNERKKKVTKKQLWAVPIIPETTANIVCNSNCNRNCDESYFLKWCFIITNTAIDSLFRFANSKMKLCRAIETHLIGINFSGPMQ